MIITNEKCFQKYSIDKNTTLLNRQERFFVLIDCKQPAMNALFEYRGFLACYTWVYFDQLLGHCDRVLFAHLSENEVSIQGRRGLGVGEFNFI